MKCETEVSYRIFRSNNPLSEIYNACYKEGKWFTKRNGTRHEKPTL